jgi:hypothetical protein
VRKLVGVGLLALALASCGGDGESATPAATGAGGAGATTGGATTPPPADTAAVCASLEKLTAAVASLQGLDLETTTKEDLSAVADRIRAAWDEAKPNLQGLGQAARDNLESALDDLRQAIDDLPPNATPAEAVGAVAGQVTALAVAWGNAFADSGCG